MTKISERVRRFLKQARQDRKGTISIITAITFSGVLGFVGLGTEASYWYVKERSIRGAVDSASFTGAAALKNLETSTTATADVRAIAAQYGFVDGNANTTVTVNIPPKSGTHKTDTSATEVIITQPQPRLFSALFLSSDTSISARAVATKQTVQIPCTSSQCGCVLALDKGNVIDVQDTGNTTINMQNCSMYVNSDDPTNALTMSGTAAINAYQTYIVGGKSVTGGAQLNDSAGTFTQTANPIPDPYADAQVPSFSGCDQTGFSLGSGQSQTLTPGASGQMVLCGGLKLTGNSTLHLGAGTYIINGGQDSSNDGFNIASQAIITSDGNPVTIILTGSSSSTVATVNISGGATVNLTAPTSGPLSGLAFFQDQKAAAVGTASSSITTNQFSGGSSQNINGALYFPNQLVTFSGGATTGGAQCTQLVAFTIKISGNSNINSNCTSAGTTAFGSTAQSVVALVE